MKMFIILKNFKFVFKKLTIVWTVRRDKFTLEVISFIVTLLFSFIKFRTFVSFTVRFTVRFTVQSSFALNPFLSKGMVTIIPTPRNLKASLL